MLRDPVFPHLLHASKCVPFGDQSRSACCKPVQRLTGWVVSHPVGSARAWLLDHNVEDERLPLTNAKRVVVKVGTAVVSNPDGTLALSRLGALVEQVRTPNQFSPDSDQYIPIGSMCTRHQPRSRRSLNRGGMCTRHQPRSRRSLNRVV
eukprot:2001750-Rhodomonas_salina.4